VPSSDDLREQFPLAGQFVDGRRQTTLALGRDGDEDGAALRRIELAADESVELRGKGAPRGSAAHMFG
jgi:hypothetical protein